MVERIFDVVIETRREVRVRVPDDVLDGSTHEDVAEEFALGGKRAWPLYVISEETDSDVDSVTDVTDQQPAVTE